VLLRESFIASFQTTALHSSLPYFPPMVAGLLPVTVFPDGPGLQRLAPKRKLFDFPNLESPFPSPAFLSKLWRGPLQFHFSHSRLHRLLFPDTIVFYVSLRMKRFPGPPSLLSPARWSPLLLCLAPLHVASVFILFAVTTTLSDSFA